MLFRVETVAMSYREEYRPKLRVGLGTSGTPVYQRVVRAFTYTEAFDKCLPDIRRELSKVQGKYLSVFVGRHRGTCYPQRMKSIQVVVETGERR